MKKLLLLTVLALVTNNGCLCKSQEPALEVEKRSFDCPSGWIPGAGKCLHWNQQQGLAWWDANDYCRAHDAELLSWRSEAEYLTFKFFWLELVISNGGAGGWTGGIKQWWNYDDWTWGNTTNDLVPINYGWSEGKPNGAEGSHECAELYSDGMLDDKGCDRAIPFICQLND